MRGLPLVRSVVAAVVIGAPNIFTKNSDVSFRGKIKFECTGREGRSGRHGDT